MLLIISCSSHNINNCSGDVSCAIVSFPWFCLWVALIGFEKLLITLITTYISMIYLSQRELLYYNTRNLFASSPSSLCISFLTLVHSNLGDKYFWLELASVTWPISLRGVFLNVSYAIHILPPNLKFIQILRNKFGLSEACWYRIMILA